MEFWQEFNNYSYLCEGRDIPNIICHATEKTDAAANIGQGTFRATDILDFKDKKEGKLVFDILQNVLSNSTNPRALQIMKCIDNDNKIESYLRDKHTYVISFCKNVESDTIWKEYAKNDGYNIIIDLEKFNKSHYIICGFRKEDEPYKHGKERYDVFRLCPVIYDKKEQEKIIDKAVHSLMKYEEATDDDIVEKAMFIGEFFKYKEEYEKEEEYRCLINVMSTTDDSDIIKESVPERYEGENGKHYAEIHYDNNAILRIECSSENKMKELSEKIKHKKFNYQIQVKNGESKCQK